MVDSTVFAKMLAQYNRSEKEKENIEKNVEPTTSKASSKTSSKPKKLVLNNFTNLDPANFRLRGNFYKKFQSELKLNLFKISK